MRFFYSIYLQNAGNHNAYGFRKEIVTALPVGTSVFWEEEGAKRVGLPTHFSIQDVWHFLEKKPNLKINDDDVYLRLAGYDKETSELFGETILFYPPNYREAAEYLRSRGWELY